MAKNLLETYAIKPLHIVVGVMGVALLIVVLALWNHQSDDGKQVPKVAPRISQSPSSAPVHPLPPSASPEGDPLMDAADKFVQAYHAYDMSDSTQDTPAERKARVDKLVLDPKKFNYQSDFDVERQKIRVLAVLDRELTDINPFDDESWLVDMTITITGHSLKNNEPLWTEHVRQSVFFVKTAKGWVAEAESVVKDDTGTS